MSPQRSGGLWLSVPSSLCAGRPSSPESTCSAARGPGKTAFPQTAPLCRSLSSALHRRPGRPWRLPCEHVLEMPGPGHPSDASPSLSNSCGFRPLSPKRPRLGFLTPGSHVQPPPAQAARLRGSAPTLASFLAWLAWNRLSRSPRTADRHVASAWCVSCPGFLQGRKLQERTRGKSQGRPNALLVLCGVYQKVSL